MLLTGPRSVVGHRWHASSATDAACEIAGRGSRMVNRWIGVGDGDVDNNAKAYKCK